MTPFGVHSGIAVPLRLDNIDTDQIIPSREMRSVSKEGLGVGLFAGWRYRTSATNDRELNPEFVLNRPEYNGASIILGGSNFGCGSSREHAVWALCDYGIRVVIAESFGRIFRSNCARNGLLAIELPEPDVMQIESALAAADPQLIVDLPNKLICLPEGVVFPFSIDDFDRHMLLNGLDYIDATLEFGDDIDAFVAQDKVKRPWAYL